MSCAGGREKAIDDTVTPWAYTLRISEHVQCLFPSAYAVGNAQFERVVPVRGFEPPSLRILNPARHRVALLPDTILVGPPGLVSQRLIRLWRKPGKRPTQKVERRAGLQPDALGAYPQEFAGCLVVRSHLRSTPLRAPESEPQQHHLTAPREQKKSGW